MNEHFITTAPQFQNNVIGGLAQTFKYATPAPKRPGVHAMNNLTKEYEPLELVHVRVVVIQVPSLKDAWSACVSPNLPWAEDHFQERISGEPLNPPPSHERWPFAQQGNDQHRDEQGQFSHTYPERFWPKMANVDRIRPNGRQVFVPHNGIRFEYGDLSDLIEVLHRNSWSRQAYLPVWFPEDLVASNQGQRVPCTLGYHFMRNPTTEFLDMEYHIRSCDFVRFFKDDIYMAGRLLQHVADQVGVMPGALVMNIANLHLFRGDLPLIDRWALDALENDDADWTSYV